VGSFTVNGANTVVKINNVTQLSGVTANNFPASSYLTYDVTPSGGATVQYQVFVRNSTFAASAMNYNQLTDTILLSFMPWFVTEQPFAITPPSPYFGYYNESTTPSFKMLGLSSIAYTDAFSGFALFYTITNIADNTTYTCDIKAAPYQIDPAKCESTTVINQPSSVVSIGANANGALTYTASYSDNKVVACASDVNISTKPYSCNDSIKTSYPEISGASAYLNYPRGMSFKFSAQLLTIVNEGDNSYVSCKIVPSGNNPTYTCTKYYFKDL
jgi:hypothetical protein